MPVSARMRVHASTRSAVTGTALLPWRLLPVAVRVTVIVTADKV